MFGLAGVNIGPMICPWENSAPSIKSALPRKKGN